MKKRWPQNTNSEGYVNAVGGFKYVFQYKDHLGNIRLSYSDTTPANGFITANEIVEESNYYPFGLKHSSYNAAVAGGNLEGQKYKFLAQERQDELG